MSLEYVIKFIKNIKEINIKFKEHSKDRMSLRNLNSETITHYILNENLLGVHKQNNNVYKLWFGFNNKKDLTIVTNISQSKLIIITVIKENNSRRLKNGK